MEVKSMMNALLIGIDLQYFKKLINNVFIDNLRIVAIAKDKNEIKKLLGTKPIDIIIINLNLKDFNNLINSNIINIQIFKKSILWIMNNDYNSIPETDLEYLYSYIPKSTNFNYITNIIKKLINYKINHITNSRIDIILEEIKKEVSYLGYNFSYNGTKYLVEAICILYNSFNYYNYNLEKDVYPIIAQKYRTTPNNIKCNIRNATEIMYFDNTEEKLMEYLGAYYTINPGSKNIISAILEKLEQKKREYQVVSTKKSNGEA